MYASTDTPIINRDSRLYDKESLSHRHLEIPITPPSLSRSLSITSTESLLSVETSCTGRESISSTTSYSDTSLFQSSFSSSSSSSRSRTRQSTEGTERNLRRGYVRPQGTNFAASAKSRESVLNLGSIAHLQYYFARTGLLDGKGGRRARKYPVKDNSDNSVLDVSLISYSTTSDQGIPYPSKRDGGRFSTTQDGMGGITIDEEDKDSDHEFYSSENDDTHPHMLPPTVSTYNHREKHIPRPPTLEELKEELEKTLEDAGKVLADLKSEKLLAPSSPTQLEAKVENNRNNNTCERDGEWHEIQGVHTLDVMTLAIRAAKMYYTAHDQPARLVSIKPERQLRADLLSVMEVLRKMATRNFASGIRDEELQVMENWVLSVHNVLQREESLIKLERSERTSWIWLDDRWDGKTAEREWEFMKSMDQDPDTLPKFRSVDDVRDDELPTEFLKDLMTGLRLVKLHNAIVRRSKQRFGAIDKWHTDFKKPYRSMENLNFWIKAAELRFGIILDIDVTSIVHGTNRKAWKQFEDAVLSWCSTARREITMELES